MDTWSEVLNKLKSYEGQIRRSYKCLNKNRGIRNETIEKHKKILLDNFESLRTFLIGYENKLKTDHNKEAIAIYNNCRDRILKVSAKHSLHVKIPHSLTEGAKYECSSESEDLSEDDTEINKELESVENENSTDMPQTSIEFLQTVTRILPDFDGKHENLQSFIDALSILETIKETHETLAVNVIKTKLKGTARNLISSETTIQQIISKLRSTVKGETVGVLSAKLMNIKQQNKNTTAYVKEIEELTKALESAYISDGLTLETAGKYATQVAVKSMAKNTQNEQVKIIMRAGQFQTMDELIMKYVDTCTETKDSSVMHFRNRRGRSFRGRGHNNNRWRNNNQNSNGNNTSNRNYNANRGRGHRNFNNNNRGYNNNNHYRTSNVRAITQQEHETETEN